MTKDEERACYERAAKVCEEYLQGPMPATTAFLYLPNKIRSLPLESKEVEEEPVAKVLEKTDGYGGCFVRWLTLPVAGSYLYTTPQPCPKCAEYEQASLGSLHYAGDLLKRAEAAEKKCAELEHRVSELLGDNALAQEAIVEQEKISEAWKALLERAEAQIKEHIEAGAANQRVMLDKWTAEKHVRQQTQERLAKALDFIFDYVELSPDDVVGQKKYDAITGGMK